MPTYQEALQFRRSGTTVATLITEIGHVHPLVFTPEGMTLTGRSKVIEQEQRPGRAPLVRVDREQAAGVEWSHTIVDTPSESADTAVNRLESVAQSGQKVRVINGAWIEMRDWWYIDDLTIDVSRRRPDQAILEAELRWKLIKADAPPQVVAKPPAPAVAAPANAASPRTHTVVKGDTLWAIAVRYLGSGSRYPEIAKLNNIKNPNLIYPGEVFKIPDR